MSSRRPPPRWQPTRRTDGSGGSRGAGWRPRKCATRSWRSAASSAEGRRAERLSADPGRGPGRPVGPRPGLAGLAAGEAARRSVYVHVKRSLLVPILATHDAADTDSSCPVRYTTTVPTQALGLLNGEFANEQAAHLADRLRREAPDDLRAGSPHHPPDDRPRARRRGSPPRPRVPPGPSRPRRPRRSTALVQYALLVLNANAFLYLD